MKKILIGLTIGIVGVAFHMAALWLTDQTVDTFPSITDVVMKVVPFTDLFGVGEVAFWILMVGFGFVLLRARRRDLGYILALLGLFYAGRGLFLLLLPIGAPTDAPAITDRLVIYPYPGHAFFPGGHVGVMFLLSMLIPNIRLRWAFLAAAFLFGIGSIVTRAHYTADIFGGLLLAYAVWNLGERHLARHFGVVPISAENIATPSARA